LCARARNDHRWSVRPRPRDDDRLLAPATIHRRRVGYILLRLPVCWAVRSRRPGTYERPCSQYNKPGGAIERHQARIAEAFGGVVTDEHISGQLAYLARRYATQYRSRQNSAHGSTSHSCYTGSRASAKAY
jgi:hypothetical protein